MDDMGAATGTTPKRKVFLRSTTDYIFKENRAAGIRGRSRLENPSRRRRGNQQVHSMKLTWHQALKVEIPLPGLDERLRWMYEAVYRF